MEQTNSEYFSDQPHSFGGKYRLYDLHNKDGVDKALNYIDVYTKFKKIKIILTHLCVQEKRIISI
jgi:hypothetical protein